MSLTLNELASELVDIVIKEINNQLTTEIVSDEKGELTNGKIEQRADRVHKELWR